MNYFYAFPSLPTSILQIPKPFSISLTSTTNGRLSSISDFHLFIFLGVTDASCKILERYKKTTAFNDDDDHQICYNGKHHHRYLFDNLANYLKAVTTIKPLRPLFSYTETNVAHDDVGENQNSGCKWLAYPSYLSTPYHTIPHQILYHTVPHTTVPHHIVIPYHTKPTISCVITHTVPYHTIQYYTKHHTILYHNIPYHAQIIRRTTTTPYHTNILKSIIPWPHHAILLPYNISFCRHSSADS